MKHLFAAGLVAIGLATATPLAAQDTIRFAVTDIDGLESLQREMGPFKDAFEAASGLKVEFFPVSAAPWRSWAMAADQVDFVLTGPAEYVVFKARLDVQRWSAGCARTTTRTSSCWTATRRSPWLT